jgi:hypothetical protein
VPKAVKGGNDDGADVEDADDDASEAWALAVMDRWVEVGGPERAVTTMLRGWRP